MQVFLSDNYASLCKKAGILIKSGLLLYGDAGIGKSNYINYLIKKTILEKNASVFNIDSVSKLINVVWKLKELREIQDNLFVVVLEELDELFAVNGVEAVLKNLMDGINSVDNLLFLSSTNYIDKIPKSLTERPSRFKKVLEIKQSEDINEMKDWLTQTYKSFADGLSKEDCEKLHDLCLNKTIDEIKHILIDFKLGIVNLKKQKKLGFKK